MLHRGLQANANVDTRVASKYLDAQGQLVISNQLPPAGSRVLPKFDLSEFRDAPMQQVQEISSIRSPGKSESSPKQDQEINIDGSPGNSS